MQETRSKLNINIGYFNTVKPLIGLVWRASPSFFVILLILTLANGLLPAANIFVNSKLIETLVQAVQSPQAGNLLSAQFILLLLSLGGLSLLEQFLRHTNETVQNLYQTRVTNYVQLMVTEKASSLDLAFFEDPEFHNLMRNASSEASFRPMMIVQQLMTIASMLTTLISLAVVLFFWQVWIVPVIVITSLITLRVSGSFARAHVDLVVKRTQMDRKGQYFQHELTSDFRAKEVRLFDLKRFFLPKLREILEQMYQQDRQLARRELLYSGIVQTALAVVRPFLVGFCAFQVIAGVISIGQFSLYTGSIISLYGSLNGLMMMLAQFHESNLFVANLFRFMALQPRVEAPRLHSKEHLAKISRLPTIEFRNVSFLYPGTDRLVIEHLNLRISPGEAVALVGENGAGKTTIVKLLAGLYEPTEGEILFDGVDIRLLDRSDLRDFLSTIFQDFGVYHLSVHENIGMGRVERVKDDLYIEEVARKTGLDPIIQDLPYKYETIIGRFFDQGYELSGGQRQLVALTRSVMRGAPILILDEPTASLDISTEQHFFQSLLDKRSGQPQSVLFISHRFTTTRRADRIIVLEQGQIIEEGNHDGLMRLNGRYAKMFNAQLRMYDKSWEQPSVDSLTA